MRVAAIIPSYRVKAKILSVLAQIGPEVEKIYVVDDECPDKSGVFVQENCADPRVQVLFNETNQGVGGAMITGYRAAIEEGMHVAVKIDGDGQMDPELIPKFIEPILAGRCDYTKGNRFYYLDDCREMPGIRIFGNAVLSFFTKLSSGYWALFDPTNGYTAISVACLKHVPLDRLSRRFFFESDILFRLNLCNASVVDVPMTAKYKDEVSNLQISRILAPFLIGHARNFLKRIVYRYFVRDFSFGSVEFLLGIVLVPFGVCFGTWKWYEVWQTGVPATSGTVMLSALPIVLGVQFLLGFVSFDLELSRRNDRAAFKLSEIS